MADVIAFPVRAKPKNKDQFRQIQVIGQQGDLTVRILARVGTPHDLIVVLDGTLAGSTTVAMLPEGELATAEATSHCVLAALQAAETTWDSRRERVARP